MPYSESVLNAARERLAQEVLEQKETLAAREREVYEKYPRVREIDLELRQTAASAVANALRSGRNPQEAFLQLKEQNLALQEERAWILESSELGADYLDDIPVCEHCKGTGYLGSEMCECLKTLCQQEQKKAISSLIGTGKERFSAFRLDIYSDTFDPLLGSSPRSLMASNLEECRKYALSFKGEHDRSLLFSGKTGLGKTFLSGCIARTLTERGFSVVYDSVSGILSDFEALRFGENNEESRSRLQKYKEADLLIVDDLGTELLNQFSMSALYTLFNDRILEEKPTIVSTNLTTGEIQARYSMQISSRLLGNFFLLYFYGEDFRTKGKI